MAKIQRILFALLLIFLPSQLGLHFWPGWAYINGVRVDYFSPTIYFTDILILLLLLLEIFNFHFSVFNKFSKLQFSIVFLTVLFIAANIFYSQLPYVSFYKWLKVGEMVFLAGWVAKNLHHNIKLQHVSVMLLIAIGYSVTLAFWQFFNQGSVGGLWWFLGERTFTAATPGIALANWGGQLILRPYATFPHPNVLMGFLVVSSLLVISQLTHNSRRITALIIFLVATVLFLLPSRGDLLKGWQLRQQLNEIAIQQWLKLPLIGTGLGTSPLYPRNIANFSLLHQPIHNIYLLILAETGLGVLGVLGVWGYRKFRSSKRSPLLLSSFFFILLSGLFDHYWLTLQQTQLLLAVVIGIIISCPSRERSPGTPSCK